MTALAAQPQGYSVEVGSTDRLDVSVVRSPMQSVCALSRAAAAGCRNREPAQVVRAITHSLRPSARFALGPLAATSDLVPDCAVPIVPTRDVSVSAQIERLRDLPPETLTDELRSTYANALPLQWHRAVDHPRRWFGSLAEASADAWTAAAGSWQDSSALFARETTRAGEAVVRGGIDALLNSLHPRIAYRDGTITLQSPCSQAYGRDGARTRIVLLPMIAGPECLMVDFSRPGLAIIGYPLPGHSEPDWSSPVAELGGDDALALVLGPLRANTLRMISLPLTAGRLARRLHCAANTVTYHCNQLEAAGLIERERQGSLVWIRRTPRGDELVELMSGRPAA